MYDEGIGDIVTEAARRTEIRLVAALPGMASSVLSWMQALSWSGDPKDRLITPVMYPMLLLPWWVEKSLGGGVDRRVESDIAYSTMNGYYFIRLLDNIMDDEDTVERQILPSSAFFHGEFLRVYQTYFESGHEFWKWFDRFWYASADVTIVDATLGFVDRDRFLTIAAQKTCAAKIPVTAMAMLRGRDDLIEPWCLVCDHLGRFQQMFDDVTDWKLDVVRNERGTYFLFEGHERKQPHESLLDWIIRDGFDWAASELDAHLGSLTALADELGSDAFSDYLERRKQILSGWKADIRLGFAELESMREIFTTF